MTIPAKDSRPPSPDKPRDSRAVAQEALLDRFDLAWQAGAPPDLDAFLAEVGPAPDPYLVRSLAAIDLERRLQRGEAAKVEDYLTRFPALPADPAGLWELIQTEFKASRRGSSPTTAGELQARFPALAEQIARQFADVRNSPASDTTGVTGERADTTGAAPRRTAQTPALGRFGDYELLEEVGRGGMGVVYRAMQLSLERIVALKVTLSGALADQQERDRFHAEAKAAARLRHPGIVTVYEVGEWQGQPYFSMEFVPGLNLAAHARRERLSGFRAATYIRKMALAIQAAHEQGIVHRDLKPSNVLLVERTQPPGSDADDHEPWEPVITDFGLARRVDTHGDHSLTGRVVGTPGYMAPEQAAGRTHEVGPLVDVYALGATLYELLTGRPPFKGLTPWQTLRDVLERPAPRPRSLNRSIPKDLETICLKCLEKNPAARYPSAAALAADLQRWLRMEPIEARPISRPARALRWVRRRPAVAALMGAAAVSLVLAATVWFLAHRDQHRTRRQELLADVMGLLEQPAAEPTFVAQLEQALERLEAVDAVAARQARELAFAPKFNDQGPGKFVGFLESQLDQPRISDADADRLRATIQRLAHLPAGASLARALEDRLIRWQDEVILAAPDDAWAETFAPASGEVQVGAEGARRIASEANRATLLEVTSQPNQEVELTFTDWGQATHLGLGFGMASTADGQTASHTLLVFTPNSGREGVPRPTLGEAVAQASEVRVQLRRAGTILSETSAQTSAWASQPLRLRLRHEGTRISWSVSGDEARTLDEIFALPAANLGQVGVYWSSGVTLRGVRVTRPSVPARPSPLEQGDALLSAGRHSEALTFFEAVLARTQPDAMRREALYKRAVCLLHVQRTAEARGEFEALVAAETALPPDQQRWLGPAICQLWLQAVKSGRLAEGDALISTLESRFRFEDLALLAPAEVRLAIIESHTMSRHRGGFFGVFELEQHIVRLRRATRVLSAMQASRQQLSRVQVALIEALLIARRLDEARQVADALVARGDLTPIELDGLDLLRHWIFAEEGKPAAGLQLVNERMLTPAGTIRPDYESYLLTRAAWQGHLGKWELAQADLDQFMLLTKDQPETVGTQLAWLMRGFVARHLGDPGRGVPQWEQGFAVAARLDSFELIDTSILGSLSGRFTVADVPKILADIPALENSFINKEVRQGFVSDEFVITLLRNMWRSKRGQAVAERLQFYHATYEEMLFLQGLLGAQEVFRQAILGESTPDEPFQPDLPRQLADDVEQMMWDAVSGFVSEMRAGRSSELDLLRTFQTYYNGVTNALLGWNGVRDRFPPEVRGPFSYAFGRRLAYRGDPEGARDLLRAAQADAEWLKQAASPHAATLAREVTASLLELGEQ